jgi:hypothetical protein
VAITGQVEGVAPILGIDVESTPGQNVHDPFGGRAYRIDSKQYPGVHLVGENILRMLFTLKPLIQ